MTSGVGGFQNPGVCLQAFPSFLPHSLPAYSRHFSRGPCSETARKRLLRRLILLYPVEQILLPYYLIPVKIIHMSIKFTIHIHYISLSLISGFRQSACGYAFTGMYFFATLWLHQPDIKLVSQQVLPVQRSII